MINGCVVCKYQQAFTIVVKPAYRIYIFRYIEHICKCSFTLLRSELRDNLEWFVDDKVVKHGMKKAR